MALIFKKQYGFKRIGLVRIPKPGIFIETKRPVASWYGDYDGDGIVNGLDCAPHNRYKQGPQHEEYSVDEELRKLRLRQRREGTFEEQQEERKRHNQEMRRMNKEAREAGFGGGMKQAAKYFKQKEGEEE